MVFFKLLSWSEVYPTEFEHLARESALSERASGSGGRRAQQGLQKQAGEGNRRQSEGVGACVCWGGGGGEGRHRQEQQRKPNNDKGAKGRPGDASKRKEEGVKTRRKRKSKSQGKSRKAGRIRLDAWGVLLSFFSLARHAAPTGGCLLARSLTTPPPSSRLTD